MREPDPSEPGYLLWATARMYLDAIRPIAEKHGVPGPTWDAIEADLLRLVDQTRAGVAGPAALRLIPTDPPEV